MNSLASAFLAAGDRVICAAQNFEGADARMLQRRVPSLSSSPGTNKLVFRLNKEPIASSEADIIHTFGIGSGAHIVSAQSCHRAGMELLRPRRDRFREGLGLGFYDRISLADEHRLFNASSTRRIIAVSRLVQSQIEEQYRINPERITVVPNGVDVKLFDRLRDEVNKADLRSSILTKIDDFVFLFAGNEFGRKGLQSVLHSIKLLGNKRVVLLVVGDGDRPSYERLAVDLGISEQVRFTGGMANPEKLFFVADAFVLPTLYEPFGLVILEAMAAWIPVITSAACGATEGMEHRKEVYHLNDPTSVDELTEAMRTFVESESVRQTIASRAREKVAEFAWDRIAMKVRDVYRGVLTAPTQSRDQVSS